MIVHQEMDLDALALEFNQRRGNAMVAKMRDLLVRQFTGRDTGEIFRNDQKIWFRLWDIAVLEMPDDAPDLWDDVIATPDDATDDAPEPTDKESLTVEPSVSVRQLALF